MLIGLDYCWWFWLLLIGVDYCWWLTVVDCCQFFLINSSWFVVVVVVVGNVVVVHVIVVNIVVVVVIIVVVGCFDCWQLLFVVDRYWLLLMVFIVVDWSWLLLMVDCCWLLLIIPDQFFLVVVVVVVVSWIWKTPLFVRTAEGAVVFTVRSGCLVARASGHVVPIGIALFSIFNNLEPKCEFLSWGQPLHQVWWSGISLFHQCSHSCWPFPQRLFWFWNDIGPFSQNWKCHVDWKMNIINISKFWWGAFGHVVGAAFFQFIPWHGTQAKVRFCCSNSSFRNQNRTKVPSIWRSCISSLTWSHFSYLFLENWVSDRFQTVIAKETCTLVRSPRASLAPWCRRFVNLFPARLYVWKQWLGCQRNEIKTGVTSVIASGSVWIVFFSNISHSKTCNVQWGDWMACCW